jgi:hypothetical protein
MGVIFPGDTTPFAKPQGRATLKTDLDRALDAQRTVSAIIGVAE